MSYLLLDDVRLCPLILSIDCWVIAKPLSSPCLPSWPGWSQLFHFVAVEQQMYLLVQHSGAGHAMEPLSEQGQDESSDDASIHRGSMQAILIHGRCSMLSHWADLQQAHAAQSCPPKTGLHGRAYNPAKEHRVGWILCKESMALQDLQFIFHSMACSPSLQ